MTTPLHTHLIILYCTVARSGPYVDAPHQASPSYRSVSSGTGDKLMLVALSWWFSCTVLLFSLSTPPALALPPFYVLLRY